FAFAAEIKEIGCFSCVAYKSCLFACACLLTEARPLLFRKKLFPDKQSRTPSRLLTQLDTSIE
ncbi:hypothetical protein, partial [Pseudomonas sp.]|uniref:hypothetical protein n=1 Tax=Pseudomonas sp. TaxID=306 RepID=UPI0028B09455